MSNPEKAKLHQQIQTLLADDGLLIRWVVIAEVDDGEQQNLIQWSGEGGQGEGTPTHWAKLGMSEAITAVYRDAVLSHKHLDDLWAENDEHLDDDFPEDPEL